MSFFFLLQDSEKEGGRVPAGKKYLTLKYMDLGQKAIERIRMASAMSIQLYEQPLLVTDNGGKGSLVWLGRRICSA